VSVIIKIVQLHLDLMSMHRIYTYQVKVHFFLFAADILRHFNVT